MSDPKPAASDDLRSGSATTRETVAQASDDLFTADDVVTALEADKRVTPEQARRILAAVAPSIAARAREQAYRDGESNREADYTAAFDEWPDLHYRDDVSEFARKVAAHALRQAADDLGVRDPIRATWLRARADQIDGTT